MTMQRAYGKIIKVSSEGWGFISSKDIEFTRIFFHWTALEQDTLGFKQLHTGMYCEFTPVEVHKGWRAIKMRIVERRPHSVEPEIEDESTTSPETDRTRTN